ncbi:MAG TPA: helicase-associated domain-containing protein [Gemmataceae bacterium]|nr:helicase-associated domain-containing protein [Gemmataceae bacterium]
MLSLDPETWTERVRLTLASYDEDLLRQVAAKLARPRSQWPAEELIERCLQTLANPVVVDRRLAELGPHPRRLLSFMARSRRPIWRLGSLLEFLAASGGAADPNEVLPLLEMGFLYPDMGGVPPRLKSFEEWLVHGTGADYRLFSHPAIFTRALEGDLALPKIPSVPATPLTVYEADGLEMPLRLAGLWQLLRSGALRTTLGGEFFKRDLDRLCSDPILGSPAAENFVEVPDPAMLIVSLGVQLGVVVNANGESSAGELSASWETSQTKWSLLLWNAFLEQINWNPRQGNVAEPTASAPFASAYVLSLLLLAAMPEGEWARPADLDTWLHEYHPFWMVEDVRPSQRRPWVATFLLGFAYPLKLVQAAKDAEGGWLVRLAPTGRWLLGFASEPPPSPAFPQTLLVQPNLEIIAFRQGMTPSLIARLTRFANWKSLGAACTLQLNAESVYRGLESGLTFESLLQVLEKHGTRALPTSVVESLRTWADKRERITVYPSATLLEFGSPEDLNEALSRGINGMRMSDVLLIVPGELPIEMLKHFRVSGNRDWAAPPEKCVEVAEDGVTLAVDLARSDLLLETQMQRFSEPVDGVTVQGHRRYRMTPSSLEQARKTGLDVKDLDEWFVQRTGFSLSPAGRLLLQGSASSQVKLRQRLVLDVGAEKIADGLLQWPQTRGLIEERLGATTLAIAQEQWAALRERIQGLGIQVEEA